MFLDRNPFVEGYAWKNWSISSYATTHVSIPCNSCARNLCVSHAILVHSTYVRPMQFLCIRPVRFWCIQPVYVMCTITLHLRRSRIPKIFCSMTQITILALQSVGFRREEAMMLSLSEDGRQLSPKVIRKP